MLSGTMVLVGMVVGFTVLSPYAIPQKAPQKAATDTPGALTFQRVCTTCHQIDRIENYQGSQSWPEVIKQMRGFGAFLTDDEAKEIGDYLQATYPRQQEGKGDTGK